MESQDYLNQISAQARPVKKKFNLFSSKYFIVGAIAIIGLILIMIVGSMIGSGKTDEKTRVISLRLHVSNTNSIIQKYQPNLKSSDLRSNTASLASILSMAEKNVGDYLVEKYNLNDKNINKKILDQAEISFQEIDETLFEAKITGVLDRIYAHKMSYEISTIMAEEAQIINATKEDWLKETLSASYGSLENLYEKFNDFSEAN